MVIGHISYTSSGHIKLNEKPDKGLVGKRLYYSKVRQQCRILVKFR